MPITFLDEEGDFAPQTTPPKRKVTFLDEEEYVPKSYSFDESRFAPKQESIVSQREIGTVEGISNAARNAFDSSRQALDIIGGVTPDEAKNIAKIEFDKESRKLAPGYDEYLKAEGMDAVWAFAKNPIEVTSNIVAEGLAGSLPALGVGLAAGGVGAVAGSVVPIIGTGAGFTAGQVAGTFTGSLATEYGSKILEEMQGSGVDLTKPESIQGFFENEELVAQARDKAIKRGVPVAAFDAISAGIGGKLSRVIGKQFLTKTGEAAAELGVQAGLGGAGEVAGAISAGEEIEPKAVFAEIIGEAGPGSVEVIAGRMADRSARIKAAEDAKIKAAAELSENLEQNNAPLTSAVIKSQAAASIEQDKLAAQLDEQLDASEIEAQVKEVAEVVGGPAITPVTPTVTPTVTPEVTPAVPTAQPTITDATQEIIQPEIVREEPQDRTQIGATEEAGVSDSLLGATRSEEERQVARDIVAELQAVANNTATREQIARLSMDGLVDVRRGQAIINEDGEGILAQAQAGLPKLTPEERAAEVEATPRPLPTDALPTETPGAEYGRESELFDVFAGVRRRPLDVTEPTTIVEQEQVAPTTPVAEAPAVTPVPAPEVAPTKPAPETTEQRYSRLLAEAEPYTKQGENYNRNIATSYERLKAGMESGSTLNEPRAEELEIRLRKAKPTPVTTPPVTEAVTPSLGVEPERIAATAIIDRDGTVLSSPSKTHAEIMEETKFDLDGGEFPPTQNFGFVTTTGRFVEQNEAQQIAQQARQVQGNQPISGEIVTELKREGKLPSAPAPTVTPPPAAEAPAPEVAPATQESFGQRMLNAINEKIAQGKDVFISTMTKSTKVNKKAVDNWNKAGRPLFKVGKDGNLYIGSGKRYDQLTSADMSLVGFSSEGKKLVVAEPTPTEEAVTPPVEPTAAVEPAPIEPVAKAPAVAPVPEVSPSTEQEELVGKKLFDAMGTLPQKANKARQALPGYTPVFKIGDFYDFVGEDAGLSGSTVVGTGKTARSSLPYYQSSNLQEIANRTGKPIAIIEKTAVSQIIQPTPVTTPPVTEAPTPAAPPPTAPAKPAGISVGNRIKLGRSPQAYTIEEVIPQSETEKELGEQYYSVRNEKTGEVQTVEAKDIKPVKAKGVRKVFAGEKAEMPQFMRDSLDTARAMAASGKTTEEIRAVTGWFLGKYDGKMRWEIPDKSAKLTTEAFLKQQGEPSFDAVINRTYNILRNQGTTIVGKLSDILDHKELYSIYPDLKNIEVEIAPLKGRAMATFIRKTKTIELNANNFPKDLRSTLLHEIQHAIQEKEEFAKGGSSKNLRNTKDTQEAAMMALGIKSWMRNPAYKNFSIDEIQRTTSNPNRKDLWPLAKELVSKTDKELRKLTSKKELGYEGYIRIAGEIEAREIEARRDLTPEQLAATEPYSSENIAPEDAIILMGGTEAASATRVKDESLVVPEAERYTFEQAEAEARKLFGGMPEGFVIVNDSVDPEYEFKAGYEPETGDIILNLAYIRKGENVRNLIAHELGHYAAGDPEIRAKLQEFLDALPPATRAKLERFVERVYNDETGDIRLEEKQVRAFVQMLKAGDQRNAFQKLLDAIKKWLNDKLGTNFQPTDMDAAAVLSGAINRFVSGEKIAREDGEMRRDTELSQMDADYLDAVERGDMETAQRMVDEAAKAAGYDVGPVWHGSPDFIGNEFDLNMRGRRGLSRGGFSFTKDKAAAEEYMQSGFDPSQRLVDESNSLMRELQSRIDNGLDWNGPYNETDVPIFRSDTVDNIDEFQGYLSEIANTLPTDLRLLANEIANRPSPEDYAANPRLIRAFLQNPKTINVAGKELILAESPNQIKSADPVTYDDAGNVIPLSQRFRPEKKDIRYAKPERKEQVGGAEREETKVITTPNGILRMTSDAIRQKIFDGTNVSPENTTQAWNFISRLLDIKSGNAAEFAGQVNDVVDLELTNQREAAIAAGEQVDLEEDVNKRIGAAMFSVELMNYAGRLAEQGDTKMLRFMIRNVNSMPVDNRPTTISDAARALRTRLEYDVSGFSAYTNEQKGKVDRTAAEMFGTNRPTKDQVDAVRGAITESENTEIGNSEEVASDIEKVEKRTGKNVVKKLEEKIKTSTAPKEEELLISFQNLNQDRKVAGVSVVYKPQKIDPAKNIQNIIVGKLVDYRKTLIKQGADGLESTFWQTMSNQERKPGPLGEIDQAQNNELAKIVQKTLIDLGLKGEPPNTKMSDIEKVASILNKQLLGEEKKIAADKKIVEEIERRRASELETSADPEAVNAKYDSILDAWNQAMSRQLNMPISDNMLQRLINAELKEQNVRLSDLVNQEDGRVVSDTKQGIIDSIIKKLYRVSKEAETGVEVEEGYDAVKRYLEQTLNNMYSLQLEKKNAAYARRQAERSLRNGAEAQAQAIINRLADELSDTPSFPAKQENQIKSIVQQDLRQIPDMKRKQPWTSQLTAKLIQAGASEAQAQTIADLVWRQHEIKHMDRKLNELKTAAEKGSLAVIIERIKNTPLEKQQSEGWAKEVIKEYLMDAGLSSEAADTAAKLYDSVISERLAAARQKVFEDTIKKSAPWKDYSSRNGRLAKNALDKIKVAIRAGVLDPENNVESIIAAQSGWSGFSKEQYQKIVQLDSVINDPKNDDLTRREAMAELNKIISKAKIPVKFKDALGAYYVGNALMGIPTLTVNIASPLGFSVRNLITDIGRYGLTNPSRIPIALQAFMDSMRSWYGNVSYSFRSEIYPNDVIEYLQGQNVLSELYEKGKEQWAKGDYANGMGNMLVGMTKITGRVLSALDQGSIAMLENQGLTRYAIEALSSQSSIPKDQINALGQAIISIRNKSIAQNVANGMPKDRAIVLADLAARSELIYALSKEGIDPNDVLNAALNDAFQSVGRNRTLTVKGLEKEQNDLSDSGTFTRFPIQFLEKISSLAANSGPGMQVFAKMLYGFALVPARVFSNVAWFSPIGAYRLAVDAFSKRMGWKSPYAMSLQTDVQYSQRLTETIAGSVVMLGLAGLRDSSADEDDEDKGFRIVITGNGPTATTDKQYYDSWNKKWKPYSIHIVMDGNIIPINIGRGGEALFFPVMLAGALDDLDIKKKQNLTKKTPEDLVDAAEVLGSAFFALAQRGPYAAFTKPLFDASKQGRVTEEIVSQAGYFGKTFIPVVGSSLSRNISDFLNDPVDRSSIEGAIYANTPIVGPWMGTKALNALGQPIRADDWGDRLFKLGVPVVFSFPKNTPENELNELILKQGSGPTIPTRANAQKRVGDIITDKEFEAYVKEYGRVMSKKMFANRIKLARMNPNDYDEELEKYARGTSESIGASESAALAVKRMRQ